MKAFIAGMITLSVLIGAVTFNCFFIIDSTDNILEAVRSLPSDTQGADASRLLALWDDSRTMISLTVNRSCIDAIDDALSQLIINIDAKNDREYLICRSLLENILVRLKDSESFSLSRIF